ncbi:DUF4143 domain-containing protein, partial [Candidatus Gribaldobacteria bacterium]|nr:DUF4143 domain-containing protein [Candidatus Gribaldobacteria bacterium]
DLLIKGKDSSVFDKKELQNYFQEYLIWGGYPRVVLSKNPEDKKAILADIYSSYIERDIIGFLKITDKAKFNKIVKLLAGQTGQLVNIGELASISELDRRTVSRHLTALEETYVISQLIPYYNNPRQEIIKNPKVYFLDNGLRNYLLDDFKPFLDRPDSGALFESSVLQELLLIQGEQLWSLRFWRTKQGSEVDFVIEQGKRLVPLEVKVSLKSPQVSPGLRSFIKKYQPQQAFMVNFGFQGKTELEKTKINFLPPFYLNKFLK